MILSFDPDRRTNAQAVAELTGLGFCPEPVIDLTYNVGKFWANGKPADFVTNDYRFPADLSHDFTTPWPEHMHESFGTVVFDPPYKLNGTPTDNDSYGVDEQRTVKDRLERIRAGVEHGTALVAPKGYLWVKYQDQVANGQMHWQSDLIAQAINYGSHATFKRDARMFVHTGARSQRSQKRPRNNYSTLEVWRRIT